MRVILHIGQHKTGSKALQSALYANREWLASHGLAYPVADDPERSLQPYEMNHHGLFTAVRAEIEAASTAPLFRVTESLRRIIDLAPTGAEAIILSAEDLFDMHTAHEDEFTRERVAAGAAILDRAMADLGTTVQIVVYLRRQDHLLAAHYAQFVKGSNTHDLPLEAFAERFEPRFDSNAILNAWEAAFGIDAITVVPYEPAAMPGGIVADFFTRALALEPPPLTLPFPNDLEAFNITPSRDHIEYMRLLNRRSAEGLPVLPRQQVLEAAFRDPCREATGIAAWMSLGDRARFLARYEPGNRRIATRYGRAETLFQERRPSEHNPCVPPHPPSLARLVEIDARVRKVTPATRPHAVTVWVMPQGTLPQDEAAAVALFARAAGDPHRESRMVARVTLRLLVARPSLVVVIGPVRSWRDRLLLAMLRWRGTRVERVQADLMSE